MQSAQVGRTFSRARIAIIAVSAISPVPSSVQAQNAASKGAEPPKIARQVLLMHESVVQEQWAHTLKLVNYPQEATLLNPGQCVRVGIVATGDNRDDYLDRARLSFRVKFAGTTQDHPLAAMVQTKQVKPEGGDLVTQALAAGGIKNPVLTMASLGATADNWCVPPDAKDGTATIEAEVVTPEGHQEQAPAKIQVESFDTGSKYTFNSESEMEQFSMTYYRHPNPARLLPLVQFFAADQKARENRGTLESLAASIGSALKADPVAACDFMTRITAQTGVTRGVGLLSLLFGGYDIGPALKAMNEQDREKFAKHPVLPDPYELSADGQNPTRLDMLWGIFTSTGQFAPVQKISTTLAWRSDWEALQKLIKTPNHPTAWTPSIARAVTYGAAGWALGSFQRTDPLAADYIQFIRASPETAEAIKSELAGLSTNPAFKPRDGK